MNKIINLKRGLKMKEEMIDLSEFNSRMKKFNNCFLEKVNKVYKSLVSLIKKEREKNINEKEIYPEMKKKSLLKYKNTKRNSMLINFKILIKCMIV